MHVRFYDRRIDAKATAARHPRPLRHVDDLPMQLRHDVRTQRARDLQYGFRIGHFVRIDAGERAIHQIGPDFLLEIVVAPVEQVLQDQHADHDLRGRARTPPTSTLRPALL